MDMLYCSLTRISIDLEYPPVEDVATNSMQQPSADRGLPAPLASSTPRKAPLNFPSHLNLPTSSNSLLHAHTFHSTHTFPPEFSTWQLTENRPQRHRSARNSMQKPRRKKTKSNRSYPTNGPRPWKRPKSRSRYRGTSRPETSSSSSRRTQYW
jgi:hypothetical protein